jgi:hypothetical protein
MAAPVRLARVARQLAPQRSGADQAAAVPQRGIGLLEHVNLYVGDEHGERDRAEAWYMGALGFMPDPRLPGQYASMLGTTTESVVPTHNDAFTIGTDDLIHVNAGLAQMHLPIQGRRGQTGTQMLEGGVLTLAYTAEGLVAVERRVHDAARDGRFVRAPQLGHGSDGSLLAIGPWGQHFRLVEDEGGVHHSTAERIGSHPPSPPHVGLLAPTLRPSGIPIVEVACRCGTAQKIADFYCHLFQAETTHAAAGLTTPAATVVFCGPVGAPRFQQLRFVESATVTEDCANCWTTDSFSHQAHVAICEPQPPGLYSGPLS